MLGDQYVAFTEEELTKLSNVVGVIISDNFFKDFYYAMDNRAEESGATKTTEFYNPETLDNTLWLHAWRIFATSPFANAIVFSKDASAVSSVEITPATATVSKGQNVQLTATVTTTGITNKSVEWTVDASASADGVTVDVNGLVKVPATATVKSITVTATSIFDNTKSDTATITVA